MNPGESSSGQSTATTSPSGPPRHDTGGRSNPELTQSQYLEAQADHAKAAMGQALAELKSRLAQGVSPAELTREHPWLSLCASTVAGFVAASALVPSKEQQALKRLARIEAALNAPHERDHNGSSGKSDGKDKGGGLLGTIIREVLGAAGPLIASLLKQPPAPDATDGGQTAYDAATYGGPNQPGAGST